MGCFPVKPLPQTQITPPDFRIHKKKSDSDDDQEVLNHFLSFCQDDFVKLDLAKNQLRNRRILCAVYS